MAGTYDRRKRIRRLKKIILGMTAVAIIIPIIACIILGVRVIQLQGKGKELEAIIASKEQETERAAGIYTTAAIEESSRDAAETVPEEALDEEDRDDQKQIFLTFDDGPSSNTDKILDILKAYDVKATFFVVGKRDEQSVKAYQRIVAEGHTLAMHSYSHRYDEIYESKESFIEDLGMLQEYLYQVTGVWPRVYRFPGGSSNTVSSVDMQELIDYLDESGITYFDWNIESGDAVGGKISAESIVENCVSRIDGINRGMILMHDAADKNTTVEALPEIIKQLQDRGDTVILPVTDETKPIHHVRVKE